MLKRYLLLILTISILAVAFQVNKEVFAKDLTLVQLARMAVESYLSNKCFDVEDVKLVDNQVEKPVGVFVTMFEGKSNSRGCWGTLYPQVDLAESLVSASIDSLKRDYRVRPVVLSDLDNIRFQVSIVTKIVPITSFREVNPLLDGLMVQAAGQTGIILPGEAIDPYYQLVLAKLKAGIQDGQHYNLYKLVTKIYKE